jgi:hypothetical protein
MNGETLLHRQIHPGWVQESRPTSQAFRPSEKDENLLSVYDGDLITAQRAWVHYTQTLNCESFGVCSITVAESAKADLLARPDPGTFPEHAVVDFDKASRKEAERRARLLKKFAIDRGWQYVAEAEEPE